MPIPLFITCTDYIETIIYIHVNETSGEINLEFQRNKLIARYNDFIEGSRKAVKKFYDECVPMGVDKCQAPCKESFIRYINGWPIYVIPYQVCCDNNTPNIVYYMNRM